MLKINEEAVICDLAETYNIYDYKSLDLNYIAILALGLRDNSRIKLQMADMSVTLDQMLLGALVDRLTLLLCGNRDKVTLVTEAFSKKETIRGFDTGEEFLKEREKILRRLNHG